MPHWHEYEPRHPEGYEPPVEIRDEYFVEFIHYMVDTYDLDADGAIDIFLKPLKYHREFGEFLEWREETASERRHAA